MMITPLLVAALQGSSPPLAVFHGDPRAPAAWVAAADAQLWICWDGPVTPGSAPQASCWLRVPLEMAPIDATARLTVDAGDAAAFRVGFVDPRTFAVIDDHGRAWTVQRDGLPIAANEAVAEAAQGSLSPRHCSPSGWLPRRDRDRRWSWEPAPCEQSEACPNVIPRIRRRPTPIDLSLIVDARIVDGRDLGGMDLGGARAGQVVIGVALGIDLQRARLARQELARLTALTRSAAAGTPVPRAVAPLAEREAAALRRARCRAWEGVR